MTIYCNRCGRPRPMSEHPCPACQCYEYALNRSVTVEGWERRQKPVQRGLFEACDQ